MRAAADASTSEASTWSQALVLVGLTGLAVTQPVLDVMGRNPEFFVAGRYTSTQIVQFGLLVALAPSVALVAVFVLLRLAHRRAGQMTHLVMVGLLGALFANVLVRGIGLDGSVVAALAVVAGSAAAAMLARAATGQLLLRYLAAANVLFLVAFLFASPVSALLSEGPVSGRLGTVTVPEPPGPVVVIVFDELPVSTLMHADGTINAERYPGFARLAARTTWFRNASSPFNHTDRAAPALLTGTVDAERRLPTYTALPRNLLALLGSSVPVQRYETVTDACPRSVCPAQTGQSLRQALSDALVVFGHRVLPPDLRQGLAPIDEAWGSFGAELDDGPPGIAAGSEDDGEGDPLARWHATDLSERNPSTQARRLVEHGLAIDAAPGLHFIHVVLPHAPWMITPWATRLMGPLPEWHDEGDGPLARWSSLVRYQRHSLQTGAADVALGQVLDHLEGSGLWDDATLVVTADHGTSTIPPHVGREAAGDNEDEIFRVPLFVKAAGQRDASVVDDVAMTIDILPTLIDLLEIETDWDLDGHSLLDGSRRTVDPVVGSNVRGLFDVVDRHAADFPHGWDWTALGAVGDHGALVGQTLDEVELGDPSRRTWAPANDAALGAVPDANGRVPHIITGSVSSSGTAGSPSLVLVVNGTIAGVAGGYERDGSDWTFSAFLGPYVRSGTNDVQAYEVTGPATAPVLHRVG